MKAVALALALLAGCASSPPDTSLKSLQCFSDSGAKLFDLVAEQIAPCWEASSEGNPRDICVKGKDPQSLRVIPGSHLCVIVDHLQPAPSAAPTPTAIAVPTSLEPTTTPMPSPTRRPK